MVGTVTDPKRPNYPDCGREHDMTMLIVCWCWFTRDDHLFVHVRGCWFWYQQSRRFFPTNDPTFQVNTSTLKMSFNRCGSNAALDWWHFIMPYSTHRHHQHRIRFTMKVSVGFGFLFEQYDVDSVISGHYHSITGERMAFNIWSRVAVVLHFSFKSLTFGIVLHLIWLINTLMIREGNELAGRRWPERESDRYMDDHRWSPLGTPLRHVGSPPSTFWIEFPTNPVATYIRLKQGIIPSFQVCRCRNGSVKISLSLQYFTTDTD